MRTFQDYTINCWFRKPPVVLSHLQIVPVSLDLEIYNPKYNFIEIKKGVLSLL